MSDPKIAVYAGSFDPITRGHLDVIKKAVNIFDVLYVGIGYNPKKQGLFTVQERIKQVNESLDIILAPDPEIGDDGTRDHVIVMSYDGLLVNFAKSRSAGHIVRGLRAAPDFNAEFELNGINQDIAPDIETVFFMAPKDMLFISSSTIRELAMHRGDVSKYVTSNVANDLKIKYSQTRLV